MWAEQKVGHGARQYADIQLGTQFQLLMRLADVQPQRRIAERIQGGAALLRFGLAVNVGGVNELPGQRSRLQMQELL